MATCEKIPPEPEPPIYRLELSEAEAQHLKSVLGRIANVAFSDGPYPDYESSSMNVAIWHALGQAGVPGRFRSGHRSLVNGR